MYYLHHRKPLMEVLIHYQRNLPDDYEFDEINGYKFEEDYKSPLTLRIKTDGIFIYFEWNDITQQQRFFVMRRNEAKFVADLIGVRIYI